MSDGASRRTIQTEESSRPVAAIIASCICSPPRSRAPGAERSCGSSSSQRATMRPTSSVSRSHTPTEIFSRHHSFHETIVAARSAAAASAARPSASRVSAASYRKRSLSGWLSC